MTRFLLFLVRKSHLEQGSLSLFGMASYFSSGLTQDARDDGESEPRTIVLSRKKRLENLLKVLRGYAWTVVGDSDLDTTSLCLLGLDHDVPSSRHGMDAVKKQVQVYLPELVLIQKNSGKILTGDKLYLDVCAGCLEVKKINDASDDRIDLCRLSPAYLRSGKTHVFVDDVVDTVNLVSNKIEYRNELLTISRLFMPEFALQPLEVDVHGV